MKIDLTDDGAIKAVVAEALLRALDEATREKLIKDALAYVLAPQESYAGSGRKRPSILEEAFRDAVQSLVRKQVYEAMEKEDALKVKIEVLVSEAFSQSFVKNREITVERISSLITDSLFRRD